MIRRDALEGEFEALLHGLTPAAQITNVLTAMMRTWWAHLSDNVKMQTTSLKAERTRIRTKIDLLMDRLVEANSEELMDVYETQIEKLRREELGLKEKIANSGTPKRSFDETLRTALAFLSNPQKLWASDRFED